MLQKKSDDTLGVTLALLAALGFSLKAIFVKLAYAYPVSPIALLAVRMLFSLPIFCFIAWQSGRKDAPKLSAKDWAILWILGLAGYYGASILDFLGLQYISAALERLILFTYPTLTILISILFFGRSLSLREVLAIVLSYVGIGFAFAHDLNLSEESNTVWLGAGLVFASSLSYAIYLSGSSRMITKLGSQRFTALCMIVSSVGVLIHFLLTETIESLDLVWQVYALGGGMAIFSTVLPVFMQSAAIRKIGVSRAVLIGTIGPIGTIFFGWYFLNEHISLPQIIGTFFVLAGVLLVSRQR